MHLYLSPNGAVSTPDIIPPTAILAVVRSEGRQIVFTAGLKGAKITDCMTIRQMYGFSLGQRTPFYHLNEVPGAKGSSA